MRLNSAHGTPHPASACACFARCPPRTRELEHCDSERVLQPELIDGVSGVVIIAFGQLMFREVSKTRNRPSGIFSCLTRERVGCECTELHTNLRKHLEILPLGACASVANARNYLRNSLRFSFISFLILPFQRRTEVWAARSALFLFALSVSLSLSLSLRNMRCETDPIEPGHVSIENRIFTFPFA